jgi:hypothetical protein
MRSIETEVVLSEVGRTTLATSVTPLRVAPPPPEGEDSGWKAKRPPASRRAFRCPDAIAA